MTEAEFTSTSFYRFLHENKLMGSKCKKCNALYLPPRPICTRCYSSDMEWVQMKGTGVLIAFTTIAVGTSLMVEEGYDRNKHYCAGIVELEEGPRISARILDIDAQNPELIKIGTPLILEPIGKENKRAILAFRALT